MLLSYSSVSYSNLYSQNMLFLFIFALVEVFLSLLFLRIPCFYFYIKMDLVTMI